MTSAPIFLPVVDAYDRWATQYDSHDNPMVFAATMVVSANEGLGKGKRVVEFGCGTGRNLASLKKAGAQAVTGLDFSQGMLEQARARNSSFVLLQHDMNRPVPLADTSADLVLFCLSLEHVEDVAVPLREAKRLTAPGGRILIVEIHPFVSQGGVAAHFHDGAGEVRMPSYAHRFQDYLDAFARIGLMVSRCREWLPQDFGVDIPAKLLKRGANFPVLVEFLATCEK